ncbi:hypothetical protein AVEN_186893-1, partial [Araneus ventricosus]
MAIIICTTTRLVHRRCGLAYAACTLYLGLGLGLIGNGKGTPIYTWMNSVRSELRPFSILHGRIKFHHPPHGK